MAAVSKLLKTTLVKNARAKCGLSQPLFGQLMGVHGMTVSKWERGVLDVGFDRGIWLTAIVNADIEQSRLLRLMYQEGVVSAWRYILNRSKLGEQH